MDKDSPAYTVGFAAAVTIVCALLLGFAATNLKELQEVNMDVDKKSKILQALGEFDPKKPIAKEDVLAFFSEKGKDGKFVVKFAVNHVGDKLEKLGPEVIKNLDLEKQMKKYPDAKNKSAKALEKQKENEAKRQYPIFAFYDNEADFKAKKASQYVIPVYGYGLWSNCYGVLSIDKDCKTVKNLVYYKHGETPGLGGEIEKAKFSEGFVGKMIHNAKGEVALTTSKNITDKTTQAKAVSGATFTMDGVNLMLKTYLTIYDAYFKKVLAGGAK